MYHRTPIALAVAAALGLCAAAPLYAQTGKLELQQAAQALGPALDALAAKTGARLLYSPEAVKGKQAPALTGNLSAEEALSRLLAGSGLTWTRSADGAYAIKAALAEKVAELAAIEVKADLEHGYAVKRSSTASKTDIPLMETPFSIQVVPREVIDDQMSSNLKDVLRNVSSVSPIGDRHYDGVAVRGFEADGVTTVYRNGLRIRRAQNDLASVENVEVLKGPAGALYGRIEPGGLVNLVTKRPQASSQYSVRQEIGPNNHLRTVGDATGALNQDRSVLYRIVGSYMDEDTFVDKAFANRWLIAPSLTWRPSAQTEVNLNYEKQHEKSQYWAGIPMVNGRPASIPISTNLGFGESKDKENQVMDKEIFGFDWSHRFNDNWKVTHRFHNYKLDYKFINTWWVGSVAADGRTLSRGLYHAPDDHTNTYATNLDLNGKFEWLGLKHDLLFGVDYFDEEARNSLFSGLAPTAYRTIDIYAPVYTPITTQQQPTRWGKSRAKWYGYYVQDQVTLAPAWKLLVGGRWDKPATWSGSSTLSYAGADAAMTRTTKNSVFNPRVGLVYQPQPWLSLYGNYVESMGAANTGTTASGATFDPQMAQQKEVGLRAELFDKKLLANVALFDLTKQNIKTTDPANPAFSIAIGEVRHRGLEIDLTGNITNALSVVATYAHLGSEITKDNGGNQGKRLYNTPKNSGSLWGKYAFGGDLYGLSAGAGMIFVGDRYGNNANTTVVPSYTRTDAMVAYTWKTGPAKLTAQLNVENLFDKVYFVQGGFSGGESAYPGAPRTVTATIRADF